MKLKLALLTIALTTTVFAQVPSKQDIKKAIPEMENVKSVSKTPIPGIFEVISEQNVVYVSKDLKYLFTGHLLDTQKKISLTDPVIFKLKQEEQAAENKRIETEKPELLKELQSLQEKNFIKQVKGNGSTVLYMVTDAQCSFCKRQEKTFEELNDITIYRIPVAFLGPKSKELGEQAFCTQDKVKSWLEADKTGKVTQEKIANCVPSIDANTAFAKKWKISGTPGLIRGDGERWTRGYLNTEDTKVFLEKGKTFLENSKK